MARTLLEVALWEIADSNMCLRRKHISWSPISEFEVQKEVHKNTLELAERLGITNWWQLVKKAGLWHLVSGKLIWDGYLSWITLKRAKWVAKALGTEVETLILSNAD